MSTKQINQALMKHTPPFQSVRQVIIHYFYTTYPPEFYRPIIKQVEKEKHNGS